MCNWETIEPRVNQVSEFTEIAGDFGDPMEVFREALHNAYDWGADFFKINIFAENIAGEDKLVIEMTDNGQGMSKEILTNNFWDLGNSASIGDKTKIGEKGHGTKIYLRSDKVVVRTSNGTLAYESICENPFRTLCAKQMHSPKIKEIPITEMPESGTFIRLEGYNQNVMTQYTQDIIKDYLYWWTKLGSVAQEFNEQTVRDFSVQLKAMDTDQFENLDFGHRFPEENNNIDQLFSQYNENAADFFVKKYVYENQHLEDYPYIRYDVVIYVEGDEAKKAYNTMLRKRRNQKNGAYKVSDRYGIYLCKDFIPIQRVNEWISSFGTGSNSVIMLHGFINCQNLKLTANRGSITNTDARIINNLKAEIQKIINEIDVDLYKNNIDTLYQWKNETKTLEIEQASFEKRKKLISSKDYFIIGDRTYLVPRNEAELYGLFISLYTLYPDDFDFEPLDYDETIGVDLIARNKTDNLISDCEYWYVELKHILSTKEFNHSFKHIRKIVCWELSNTLLDGSTISSVAGDTIREFSIIDVKEDSTYILPKRYYLEADDSSIKIEVIPLKKYIEAKGIEIRQQ